MIHRKGASLIFGIYRKATHSDLYLQWSSHHTHAAKMAVVRSLVDRAFRLCSESKLGLELKHIEKVLKQNGFPDRVVRGYIQKKRNQTEKPKRDNSKTTEIFQKREDKTPFTVLPYVEGLTQNLSRLLTKNGIKCAITSRGQRLRDQITKIKDPQARETKPCVYEIPCYCGKKYIGQTGRKLKVRISEHKRDVRYDNRAGSAFVEHLYEEGDHGPLWEKAKVVDNEEHLTKRLTKEAMHIHMQKDCAINRMDGTAFSSLWDTCLNI